MATPPQSKSTAANVVQKRRSILANLANHIVSPHDQYDNNERFPANLYDRNSAIPGNTMTPWKSGPFLYDHGERFPAVLYDGNLEISGNTMSLWKFRQKLYDETGHKIQRHRGNRRIFLRYEFENPIRYQFGP
jgi:hypothetical protein